MLEKSENNLTFHATTILCVRHKGEVVIAADGQVSFGNNIMKSNVRKLRTISNGAIVAGFAGSTADAFTLFERLEAKLEKHSNQLLRSCVELVKDWRTDKYLRKLEAMLIVADKDNSFILTGNGDMVEPEDNIAAIGSGGFYALSAARALVRHGKDSMSAQDIAAYSMKIASEICVFSNDNIIFEKVV
jgi:ATP-dependent HslUV protease subunit HslV